MRRFSSLVAVVLIAAGCSNAPTASPSAPPSAQALGASPPPGSTVVAGGCGSSQVYRGGIPDWINQATGNNTPDSVPYTIASPPIAAGFIFGYPLKAGHPYPNNKILWVVGKPRNGSPLQITGQLSGATQSSVRQSEPANSGGDIYPSIVDVPQAGCWRFDLSWSGHHTVAYLVYQ